MEGKGLGERDMRLRGFGYRTLILLFLLALPHSPSAQMPSTSRLDPSFKWKTISTRYFVICYHEGVEGIAERIAKGIDGWAEPIFRDLGYRPVGRTWILLSDDMDESGAFTSFIPKPYIRVLVPNERNGVFGEDWYRYLLVHEISHLVHIGLISSPLMILARLIFGDIVLPNMFQPSWMMEGYAIYNETRLTPGGRLKDPSFDMMMRADFLEGKLLPMERWLSSSYRWPGDMIPYLYGGFMALYMSERFGEEVFKKIAEKGGSSLRMRYGSLLEEVTGIRESELYRGWAKWIRERYENQVARIKERPLTKSRAISSRGFYMSSPRWSPDGRSIWYAGSSYFERGGVFEIDPITGKERRVISGPIDSIAFSPDGRFVAFSKSIYHKTFRIYNALFTMDRKKGREKRRGIRLIEPDWSKKGIACVEISGGRSNLVLIDPNSWRVRRITDFDYGIQISSPSWSPDGSAIAISVHKDGKDDIWLISSDGNLIKPLTDDPYSDGSPRWTPDGRFVLFSSDRSGIPNIYAVSLEDGTVFQVTNVLTGAFSPVPSPSGKDLAFLLYTSKGYELHLMELDPGKWERFDPGSAPRIEPPGLILGFEGLSNPENPVIKHGEYSPFPTIVPTFFLPTIGENEASITFGIYTFSFDISQKHKLSFSGALGLGGGEPSYRIQYRNGMFFPELFIDVSREPILKGYYINLMEGRIRPYWEQRYKMSGGISIPFVRGPADSPFKSEISLELGWERLKGLIPEIEELTPWTGWLAGPVASIEFEKVEKYKAFISPVKGISGYVGAFLGMRELGSKFPGLRITSDFRGYIPMPAGNGQNIALRIMAGHVEGDLSRMKEIRVGGTWGISGRISPWEPGFPMRGYDVGEFRCRSAVVGSLEYRIPFPYSTGHILGYPVYISNIYGAGFVDGGVMKEEDGGLTSAFGLGMEMRAELRFGYYFGLTTRLGIAWNKSGRAKLLWGIGDSF
jgi:Tol biopolymer transport system component